jgi:beta-glucanase (GH16 family)
MMPLNGTKPDGIAEATANDGAEIDILEGNRQSESYSTNIHWDGYGTESKSSWVVVDNCFGLHTNFYNTFGLEWNPKELRFYFNGQLKRVINKEHMVPHVPEHLIVSGGIFAGVWVDGDVFTADFPDTMYVDYVRVFKNKKMDFGGHNYIIKNTDSDKYMTIQADNSVTTEPVTSSEDQLFKIYIQTLGYYKIVNQNSGASLGINPSDEVLFSTWTENPNQMWYIDYAGGVNYIRFINLSNEKVLEADQSGILRVNSWNGSDNQKWEIHWQN